jgi:hypothetical protein
MIPAPTTHPAAQRLGRYPLLVLQLVLATTAMGALLLWPVTGRPMLVLPLPSADEGAAARFAVAHGARLLGRGPIGGSVVVRASRGPLVAEAWAAGLLVVGANGGCGSAGVTA